jgi:hypothetical protein
MRKADAMLSEIERLLEACGAKVQKKSAGVRSEKSMFPSLPITFTF